MKDRGDLRNQLKAVRLRLRMSQQELADAAGVARQTIGGMEAELYSPSAAVALRLARALGCTVEELFWLESQRETVIATAAQSVTADAEVSVSLVRVGDRWVAHSLEGERAFRSEMVPADGRGKREAVSATMQVELVDDADALARTVAIAGCAPALSLWARSAERWFPGLRVHWVHANSMDSLIMLEQRNVHMAGLHLRDSTTGEYNRTFVLDAIRSSPTVLVNLGEWEEGLVVQRGNPKSVRSVRDLAKSGVKIINRDPGSGSRLFLDIMLRDSSLPINLVEGYSEEAASHQEVGRIVAAGNADAGVSVAAIAANYGLGFVPLGVVRYDLAMLEEHLEHEPVRQLLATLQHRWVRRQLSLLGGFDTRNTGEVTRLS